MSQFAVVQEAYEKLDPERLGPVLEKTLGLLRFDAMRMAREGRGILAEHLDAGRAEALGRALAEAGIETRTVPQEKIIRIGRPVSVREIRIADDALGVMLGYTGQPQPVPWENVRFLSAGEVVEVTERRVVQRKRKKRGRGGLFIRIAMGDPLAVIQLVRAPKKEKQKVEVRRSEMNVHLADIFATTAGGEYLHVRLRSRDLYYEKILGADATRNFLQDFRLVLARLGLNATQAFVSPGYRAIVLADHAAEIDPEDAQFGDQAEFTQYNRWQLQALLLEAAQDSGGA